MLLNNYQLLLDDPSGFLRLTVLVASSLVLAVTVHEFSHALVATGLGDKTANALGRLSLSPQKHLDPTGAVMMLVAGFGWGKPVPVNGDNLSHGQTGMALVAAAGPLSNLVVAFLLALPIKLGLLDYSGLALNRAAHVMTGGPWDALADIIGMAILFNILLAVFNLIPLAPLDGSKILAGFVPPTQAEAYARLQNNGPVILIGLIMLDYMLGLGILWGVIGPVVGLLTSLAIGY